MLPFPVISRLGVAILLLVEVGDVVEGIDVIRVPGGELAGCRGGPRAICCPVGREPAAMPEPMVA